MEVILLNKANKEIFINLFPNIEKFCIQPEKTYTVPKLKDINIYIEISYKNLISEENFYELIDPCKYEITEDGLYQINDQEKIRCEKLKKEDINQAFKNQDIKSSIIQSVCKSKSINYNYHQFKKDNYYIINNDKSRIYIFKEIKYLPNKTVEASFKDKDSLKEIYLDCLRNKFSNMVKLKLYVIHSDNIIFEKYIIIDINQKIKEIHELIEEKLKTLTIGNDFRLVYKNQDISTKPLNTKFFRENINEYNKLEVDEINRINKKNSKEPSWCDDDSEEMTQENVIESENEDSQRSDKNSINEETESYTNSDEEIFTTKSVVQTESEIESNSISLEKKINANDLPKKGQLYNKIAEISLIDLNFNFEKDYVSIIPTEINYKVINLTYLKDVEISSDNYRDEEISNTFIFSNNIIIKNICISWYNNGNPCDREYPEYDFMIYEMDIDPMEKASDLQTYYSEDNTKYKDLASVWDNKKAGSYKLIFEKRKIKADNCEENSEYKKIMGNGFIFGTNEIKVYKNKIYCFIFKYIKNPHYYVASCIYYSGQKFKIEGEEDLCIYGYSKSDNYMLLSLNYKLDISNL